MLSQAAREGIYLRTLLKELEVNMDSETVVIQCDNQQTLRLVKAEVGKLYTKLRISSLRITGSRFCEPKQAERTAGRFGQKRNKNQISIYFLSWASPTSQLG